MIEPRKQQEAEFHNQLRDRSSQTSRKLANRKFYSIVRRSRRFVNDYLARNCSGKKVLDYCCGDGEMALLLAEEGAQATGIDISFTSIQNCQESALKKGLLEKTNFLVMDAENLKFEDNYFDLIVCSGVLHHLDVKKAYPELARVLKPDGKIVCDEPLIHNPIFQLYRKITPQLRTEWETHHILSRSDIELARDYFGEIETNFFHLFALLAVPFRNLRVFNCILSILEKIDSVILRMPLLKWWAWQIVFILSKPYGDKKTRRN